MSTAAASWPARRCGTVVSPSTRWIVAAAASPRPWSEAQQREARLRLAPETTRVPVGALGRGELAAKSMELRLPVEGVGCGSLVEAGGEPLAGAPRLEQRVVPVAGELQDLGPVDEAPSGERDEVRLALAPPAESRGPLPGAADLVHLLAREDHAAVDETGDDRRELARRQRHHRLVEERQALGDPAARRQHLALCMSREGEEIRVAEAPSDRRGLARGRGRRLPVPRRGMPEHVRDQGIAALDAVPLVLEQALCPPEPARGRPHLASQ